MSRLARPTGKSPSAQRGVGESRRLTARKEDR